MVCEGDFRNQRENHKMQQICIFGGNKKPAVFVPENQYVDFLSIEKKKNIFIKGIVNFLSEMVVKKDKQKSLIKM